MPNCRSFFVASSRKEEGSLQQHVTDGVLQLCLRSVADKRINVQINCHLDCHELFVTNGVRMEGGGGISRIAHLCVRYMNEDKRQFTRGLHIHAQCRELYALSVEQRMFCSDHPVLDVHIDSLGVEVGVGVGGHTFSLPSKDAPQLQEAFNLYKQPAVGFSFFSWCRLHDTTTGMMRGGGVIRP